MRSSPSEAGYGEGVHVGIKTVSGTKEGADPEEGGHPKVALPRNVIGPSMDLSIIASYTAALLRRALVEEEVSQSSERSFYPKSPHIVACRIATNK